MDGITPSDARLDEDDSSIVNLTMYNSFNTDAKPLIKVEGDIKDQYDNIQTGDSKESEDGIKPTMTGAALKSQNKIEVTFSENLDPASATDPTVYGVKLGKAGEEVTINVTSAAISFNKVTLTLEDNIETDATDLVVWVKQGKFVDDEDDNQNRLMGVTPEMDVEDGAPPILLSAKTQDGNRLELKFSESIDENSLELNGTFIIRLEDTSKTEKILDIDVNYDFVILTLEKLESDDRPSIEINGEILDLQGNVQNKGTIDADDGIPPTIVKTSTSAIDQIDVEFSEPLSLASLQAGDFEVELNEVNEITLLSDGKTVRLYLEYEIDTDETPLVSIIGEVADTNGNTQDEGDEISEDETPPEVDEIKTMTVTTIEIEFSEPVENLKDGSITVQGYDVLEESFLTSSILQITLTTQMNADSTPEVRIGSGSVTDEAGNIIDSVIMNAEDGIKPSIKEAKTWEKTQIRLIFTEDVDDVDKDDFLLSTGNRITDVQFEGNSRKIWILYLQQEMNTGATPTVSIKEEILDLAGNVQEGGSILCTDGLAPEIDSAESVSSQKIEVTFSEELVNVKKEQFTVTLDGETMQIERVIPAGTRVDIRLEDKLGKNDEPNVTVEDVEDAEGNILGFGSIEPESEIPNTPPRLSNPRVDPSSGYEKGTGFNFTIEYSDEDKDQPEKVTVIILKDGIEQTNKTMNAVDPDNEDYEDGVMFYYNTSGNRVQSSFNLYEGEYNFRFQAYDGESWTTQPASERITVEKGSEDKYGVSLSSNTAMISINMERTSPEGEFDLMIENTGNVDDNYELSMKVVLTKDNRTTTASSWRINPDRSDTIGDGDTDIVPITITPWINAEAGDYTMTITAISASKADISDTYNLVIKLLKPSLKSAEPSDLSISNTEPRMGDEVTLSFTVSNYGDVVAKDTAVTFYANSQVVGTTQTVDVPAQGSSVVTVTWKPDATGEYTIKVEIEDQTVQDLTTVTVKSDSIIDQITDSDENGMLILIIGIILASILWIVILAATRGKKGGGAEPGSVELIQPPGERKPEGPETGPETITPPGGRPEAPGPGAAAGAAAAGGVTVSGGEEAPEKPEPKKSVGKVKCPKCGKVTEVTSSKRPLIVPCPECSTKLLIKE